MSNGEALRFSEWRGAFFVGLDGTAVIVYRYASQKVFMDLLPVPQQSVCKSDCMKQ